jgi:membrane-bound ClpP family serine protease
LHAAVGFAILSLAGTATGIIGLFTLLTGGEVERPLAAYSQSAMFLMCTVYIVAAVKSFKAARKSATE